MRGRELTKHTARRRTAGPDAAVAFPRSPPLLRTGSTIVASTNGGRTWTSQSPQGHRPGEWHRCWFVFACYALGQLDDGSGDILSTVRRRGFAGPPGRFRWGRGEVSTASPARRAPLVMPVGTPTPVGVRSSTPPPQGVVAWSRCTLGRRRHLRHLVPVVDHLFGLGGVFETVPTTFSRRPTPGAEWESPRTAGNQRPRRRLVSLILPLLCRRCGNRQCRRGRGRGPSIGRVIADGLYASWSLGPQPSCPGRWRNAATGRSPPPLARTSCCSPGTWCVPSGRSVCDPHRRQTDIRHLSPGGGAGRAECPRTMNRTKP